MSPDAVERRVVALVVRAPSAAGGLYRCPQAGKQTRTKFLTADTVTDQGLFQQGFRTEASGAI